jgi:hypothetical protein
MRRLQKVLCLLIVLVAGLICALPVVDHYLSPGAMVRARFERIQVGMTKDEVISLVGPPSDSFWHPKAREGWILWVFHYEGRPAGMITVTITSDEGPNSDRPRIPRVSEKFLMERPTSIERAKLELGLH